MTYRERARLAAWEARKRAFRAAKSIIPAWLKYSDYVSIQFVREAWPPLVSAAPAPLVHWPDDLERDWFDRNWFFAKLPIVLPPVLVHEIKDGILFPDTGTIATPSGCLIEESCKDRAVVAQSAAYNRLRLRRVRSMGDKPITSVLIGKLGASYGHWVLDALPRLWALSLVPERVSLLVPRSVTGPRRRLLELAAPQNVDLVTVDGDQPVRAPRVLLSPFTTIGGCGLMRPEVVDHLRQVIPAARASAGENRGYPPQIYISREKARWSNVSNEGALKEALRRAGIVSIVAEDLSIEEQIAHFSHAELVVGALGSGMVNCLFQKAGGTLIELMPGGLSSNTHTPSLNAAGVAIAVGLTYIPVYHGHRDPEPSYSVDVDRVVDVVARAQAGITAARRTGDAAPSSQVP